MPAPAAPTNFEAVANGAEILLTWDAVAGIDNGYIILRGTASNHSDAAQIATVASALRFDDFGVTPGTHYYYRIQASDTGDGESAFADADATAQGSGMTLTEARDWVRTWARNAQSSAQYSDEDID